MGQYDGKWEAQKDGTCSNLALLGRGAGVGVGDVGALRTLLMLRTAESMEARPNWERFWYDQAGKQ